MADLRKLCLSIILFQLIFLSLSSQLVAAIAEPTFESHLNTNGTFFTPESGSDNGLRFYPQNAGIYRSTQDRLLSNHGNVILSRGHGNNISYGNTKDIVGEDTQVSCGSVHSVNSSERCEFVRQTTDCQIDQGFIHYTQFIYCDLSSRLLPLGVCLLALWWLFLFIALAVTADDFFCPSLVVISKTLRISDNIAGVTFLAFGNGAPDVFSSIAAIGNMQNGDAGLSIGALFGAGIFVTTVVAGSIAVVRPFKAMERPFLRDVIFYLCAVFFTFYVLYDKKITLAESLGFVGVYILYVVVVVVGRYIYQKQKRSNTLSIRADDAQGESSSQGDGTTTAPTAPTAPDVNQPALNGDPSFTGTRHHERTGYQAGEGTGYQSNRIHPYEEPTWDITGRVDYYREMGSLLKSSTEDGGAPSGEEEEEDERTRGERFCDVIKPFSADDWRDARWYGRVYIVVKTPITVVLKLTVPVVDYEAIHNNWNKDLHVMHCVTGPLVAIFLADYHAALYMFGGVFPACLLVLILGLILAAVVWFTSSHGRPPVYHPAFAFLGFGVAVIWIESIANEIVNLLQTIGVVFNISNAVLGLTLLAWGNSIGDLIADTSMARQGFPRTGISACFGGPLFNLLLGIGIPFTIKVVGEPGHELLLDFSIIDIVLTATLMFSLAGSLTIIPLYGFNFKRGYGFYLYGLYGLFLVMVVLVETNVITDPNL